MEEIGRVDTTNIELKQIKLNAESELDADSAKKSLTKEDILKNAPDSMGASIAVPMMVD